MHERHRLATLAGVLLALVSCSPPVPKAYGVYARDGRQLIDLTDQLGANAYQLSPEARIIVFEREIADPGFAPESRLQLFRSGYVRDIRALELQVTPRAALELINRGSGKVLPSEVAEMPVAFTNVTASGAWANVSEPLQTRIEPLDEQRDMLALVPTTRLSNGSYALLADLGHAPKTVRFGVGLPSDEIGRQKASCVDELIYVVSKPDGFLGWDQWIRDFSSNQRQRRMVGSQPVIASSFVSCEDADNAPHPRVLGVTTTDPEKADDARTFRVSYVHRETGDVKLYVVPVATGRPRTCFTPTYALAPPGNSTAEPKSTYFRCSGQPDVVRTDLVCVQLSHKVRDVFYVFYRQCFPQQLEWFATELRGPRASADRKPPAATAAGGSGGLPLRVGGDVLPPVLISRVEPVYTDSARRVRLRGDVILEAVIGIKGEVASLQVVKGLPFDLSQTALEAVKQWHFKPATKGGQPVTVYFTISVHFSPD